MHSRHFYCSIACKRIANPQKKPFIVSCTNCGKNASFTRAYYLRKKNSEKTIGYFCSKTCEGKYRTKISRDVRTCEFCKKSFVCKKGNKLRFCSTKCQSKWQKVTNSGKNHPSYNHNVPDELRIKKCGSCGKEMFLHPKEFEKKLLAQENA